MDRPIPAVAQAAGQDAGVVAAIAYSAGQPVARIAIAEAGAWSCRPGHLVWIGLREPSAELLREVQAQFGLHDLAIEDAHHAHQRPKVERYGDGLFVVARTAQMVEGRLAFGETHLFVGKGYVVSVRHGASSSYAAVRTRCEACPAMLARGEDYILYAILDFIVDEHLPVLEAITAEVEGIEDRVLEGGLDPRGVERLYALRRDLLRLRNGVVPLVEVCKRLEHAVVLGDDPAMAPFLRDVTDHVNRVREEIESLREVLAFAFEASLLTGQTQQTQITRRLAAWAAILAVPTAIAGIYGMNFDHMPELKWEGAYFVVLLAIAGICGTLWWRLRRMGWL